MCVYIKFSETGQWTPGSLWTSRWKFVLTVYVCAPADMHSAVDSFMEVWRVVCVSMCSLVYLHVFCVALIIKLGTAIRVKKRRGGAWEQG